jgi:hypothetical protein
MRAPFRIAGCAIAVAAFAVGGCGASGAPPTESGPERDAATSIPLVPNIDRKSGYHVVLSIAGTASRGFLFDTGSGGLWVYANAIAHPKKPVRDLHIETHNQYDSGLYYEGKAVETTIDFGNDLPTETLPFVLVTKAYCVTQSCTKTYGRGNVIRRLEKERGLWGTFGADLQPKPISQGTHVSDLFNLLYGLGSSWTSFAITPTEIEAAPSMNEFTTIAMDPGPATHKPLPNGAKSWERDVGVCFKIGDPLIYAGCVPTVFDTGASGVSFRTLEAAKLPAEDTQHCGEILTAGTSFSAITKRRKGTVLEEFESGTTQNWNEVKLETPEPTASPQVNTGLTFYNRNEIAFDAVHGLVGLRPLHRPVHKFESDCNSGI